MDMLKIEKTKAQATHLQVITLLTLKQPEKP